MFWKKIKKLFRDKLILGSPGYGKAFSHNSIKSKKYFTSSDAEKRKMIYSGGGLSKSFAYYSKEDLEKAINK